MELTKLESREDLATAAAEFVLAAAERAIGVRGAFAVALSGGSTPWATLREVVRLGVARGADWSRWHVFQVDERCVPDDDEARNWRHIRANLLERVPIPNSQCHPMPVLAADPVAAATAYASLLPAALDLVQLGLGDDGHTASLVPGDPVLHIEELAVAWSLEYRGQRRMTLTYPTLQRALDVCWLIAGADKLPVIDRVFAADPALPATRIARGIAFFAD